MTRPDITSATALEKAVTVAPQQIARRGTAPVEEPPTVIVFDEAAHVSRPLHDLIADLMRQGRTSGVHMPRRRRLVQRQYPTLDALTAAIDRGEA
ncbi:MAG TPA: hypothetical protein VN520_38055 [Streptomyces sp.]|uniref:hypothetical protein n=1 Tax=Streptomyces sp. TaxID=1931 RepID=UPI002C032A29|nr:hypothetical protein [Streptomyces sp.]HWU12086.1 hypothetical protein [Streptomyces sp.]